MEHLNPFRFPLSIHKDGIIVSPWYKLLSQLCFQIGSDPLQALCSEKHMQFDSQTERTCCTSANALWTYNYAFRFRLGLFWVFFQWRSLCLLFRVCKILGNTPWILLPTCHIGWNLHRDEEEMIVRAEIKIILNTAWKKNGINAASEPPYCSISFKKLSSLSASTY